MFEITDNMIDVFTCGIRTNVDMDDSISHAVHVFFDKNTKKLKYAIVASYDVECKHPYYDSGIQEYSFNELIDKVIKHVEYHFEFKNKHEFIKRFIQDCAPFFYTVYDKTFYEEILNFCMKFNTNANTGHNRSTDTLLIFTTECEFAFIYPKIYNNYYDAKRKLKQYK